MDEPRSSDEAIREILKCQRHGRQVVPLIGAGLSIESGYPPTAAIVRYLAKVRYYFDEELYLTRPHPLALGDVQALPVPGHCELGDQQLELHPAQGHTGDGMAVWSVAVGLNAAKIIHRNGTRKQIPITVRTA